MAEHDEPGGTVSRRAMLGGAGAAVLGGVIGGVAASAGGVAFATTPPSGPCSAAHTRP